MNVSQRFSELLQNLALTSGQQSDGATKHHGVRKCLNRHYYNSSSETANSRLIGSWAKSTEIRPPRDIDVLFVLPDSVFVRYQSRPGNKQSQLLQEVRGVLKDTYPNTKLRADGQVVLVPFSSYAVEVIPAFTRPNSSQYWICDTADGGRYKTTDPEAEQRNISASNTASNGNTRDLVRMMKCWQDYCNVDLKSFCIELLSIDFLGTWQYRGKSTFYYDWMVRDFFAWLLERSSSYVIVPGTYDLVDIGDSWRSRAESAHGRAKKACESDAEKLPCIAGGA